MRRGAIGFAVTLSVFVLSGGPAAADDPPSIVLGPDGRTAPVFGYADAIRERVFIPVAGVDQDGDGVTDRVAADVIRPAATESGLAVPAIIDPSPYFTSVGREGEYTHTTAGVPDRFPFYYDNYFVPRGYAVILAQANGTGFSTGCPLHGGRGDIASIAAVIDWLQGRVSGFDGNGDPVVADWDNGKAATIGKSYDGTLANGVAATGIDGLTTIVPITAISDWYRYSRTGGIRAWTGTTSNYPAVLSDAVMTNRPAADLGVVPTNRRPLCAGALDAMRAADGDETGDVNAFWAERDYTADVGDVKASVLLVQGLNDDNVRTDHFGTWWAGLAANGVPRKLWLSQEGHVDPFNFRRAAWVDTLHRWFDYWLQGVPNGIMSEPRVTIERSTDVFEEAADWPLPGTANVDVFLHGTAAGAAGTFGLASGGGTESLTFTDLPSQTENTMINDPTGSQANRLVFLSPVLTDDLHLSGTPTIQLQASFNKTTGNLGALLVDYAPFSFTRPSSAGDGVVPTGVATCWGESSAMDDACFDEMTKPTVNVTRWQVSKGILAAENRLSLFAPTDLVPDAMTSFGFPVLPADYVFEAGHQLGIILVSNYSGFTSTRNQTLPVAQVTVDTRSSKVVFPVVGGLPAAEASGAFAVDTTAPVLALPAPIMVEAAGATTPVAYSVTASDDRDASPDLACTPASGSAFPLGTTTVTCTATDATGNVANGSFPVTVADTRAPALHLPDRLDGAADGPGGRIFYYHASASDTVDPSPTLVCVPGSGATFAVGTTVVRCSGRDASGNVATGSFLVTVTDRDAPTLRLPAVAGAGATSRAGEKVSYDVTADDLVDPRPSVVCAPASGSIFPFGTTTVRCTATDASGNVATGSFEVHVLDVTRPNLRLPSRIRVNATSPGGAAVAFAVTAGDAVDPAPRVSCIPASGSVRRIGFSFARCTATDAAGNTFSRSISIHVLGAKEQLSELRAGVAPWKALASRVDAVRVRLAAGRRGAACNGLDAFREEVRAQSGRSLIRARASAVLEDAARIAAVIGC